MMKAKLLSLNKVLIIFFAISFFVSFMLFRHGEILATAEEGMPFYEPARTANLYSSIWWEEVAPGALISTSSQWLPLYWVSAFLNIYLANFVVQAIFFGVMFFSGMLAMYLLSSELTKNKVISLLASTFYLLNLYTMSQILFRALYMNLFVWAFSPLYIYLFKSFIKEGKKLFVLVATSVLFSYGFTHPGYLILFCLVSFLIFAYVMFKDLKNRFLYLKRLVVLLAALLIFHIWWIYPMAVFLSSTFNSSGVTSASNYSVLEGVSQSFPVSEILLLRERYYHGNWFNGQYKEGLAIVPSIVILLFVIYGLVKARKFSSWGLIVLFFSVGFFISKGINPPLGALFYKILYKISLFGAIRNPYEKIGLLYLVPYSIFFASGIFFFYQNYKKIFHRLALFLFLAVVFGPFSWPYWSGKIYPEFAMVKVPGYYKEANNYLNQDKSDSRILVLPLIPEHAAVFNWDYRGVEPSRFLFDKPTISVNGGLSRNLYSEMRLAIKEESDLSSYLKEFNVGYVVIRNDLDTTVSGTDPIDVTKRSVMNTSNLDYVGNFGEVDVYKHKADQGQFQISGNKGIGVSYQKLGPRKYIVNVSDADNPSKLVFKQTYHDNWIAKLEGKILIDHSIENGYENAWLIDKSGDFQLEVNFKVWPWE